jgi:MinD superfamily P-loop ATPase
MMRELVVVSGKGGTGKTSIVAAFASLQGAAVLADCDVDASNLHLLLEPRVHQRNTFRAGFLAAINEAACTECGICQELCRFDAVLNSNGRPTSKSFSIDENACEGCGVCAHFCPEGAIELEERVSGEWFVSDTRFGPMVHARLGIAAENSGKLVTKIRDRARELAAERELGLVIVDGSPGIGCPVIASVTGSDLVVAVTEPTLSGLHDLKRVAELATHFGLPMAVVVNKFDLNESMALEMERYCEKSGFQVAGRIPYSPDFIDAMVAGKSIVEFMDGPASRAMKSTWKEIRASWNRN